jgi:tRNA(fMet)-specific endonuclease VapC
MLDTNTVSHLLRKHPKVGRRLVEAAPASLYISAVTEGELLFGLAKRPEAAQLHVVVGEFLKRVDVLPWDREIAARYGLLRADLTRRGQGLAPLDLLIAAHALAIDAVLVTSDRAFARVPGLMVEDWTV